MVFFSGLLYAISYLCSLCTPIIIYVVYAYRTLHVMLRDAASGGGRLSPGRQRCNAEVNVAHDIIRKAFLNALVEGIEDTSLHPVRMPLGTACEST